MLLRAATIILTLLTNGSFVNAGFKDFSERNLRQAKDDPRRKIKCIISTNDMTWHSGSGDAAIAVEFQLQGATELSLMPSLHMTALPKRQGVDENEYWAPFAIPSGASTKETQKLRAAGVHSLRLVPGQLLWAPTKSSVWPSQQFAKIVPPGEYSLQVQLEIEKGGTITSNEGTVTVLK